MKSDADRRMKRPNHPVRLFFIFSCALLLLFWLHVHISPRFSPEVAKYALSLATSNKLRQLNIAVVGSEACHDDVAASFFAGFGQMSECTVNAFLAAKSFGIENIHDQLPGYERRLFHNANDFLPDFYVGTKPDVVVLISGEKTMLDDEFVQTLDWLFEATECLLLVVIHNPEDTNSEEHISAARAWIESKRIHFITPSDHVSRYMSSNTIGEWYRRGDISRLPNVDTFPPVFIVPSLRVDVEDPAIEETVRYALQGGLIGNDNEYVRDYDSTFKHFAKAVSSKDKKSLVLNVLGHGTAPTVPEGVRDRVKIDVELPYLDFYQKIRSTTALLPAFADSTYVRSRSSSSVPTSFIAGVPLIADDELLDAYTFVVKEDVYYREKGETEVDVMVRIAQIPEKERLAKSRRVREKNIQMTKAMPEQLRMWIAQYLAEKTM